MPQFTCGECRHWHKLPPNPQAINEVRGECRSLPPQVAVFHHVTTQGVAILGNMAMYPSLAPNFAACGQFEPRPAGAPESKGTAARMLISE